MSDSVQTNGKVGLLKRLTDDKSLSLASDSIATVLFVSGFTFLFFTLTNLELTLVHTLWMAIVCTTVNLLLTRRWWIPVLLLFLVLAVAGIVIIRLDAPMDLLREVLENVRMGWWILTGYTASTPEILPYLAWATVWIVSIPVFLIIRRLFSMLAMTLLVASVFITLWFIGWTPSIPAMALCIAGLAALLPRRFAWSVNRRAEIKTPVARGAMQTLAIPVAILCILSTLLIVPADTSSWRLRILVNTVTDMRDLLGLWEGDTRFHEDFSIATMGYQPLGSRLGGPIQPSAREYLRLQSDEGSLYLRAGIRDTYTGTLWQDSDTDEEYRFGSIFWRGLQNEAFDAGRPAGGDRNDFLDEVTVEAKTTITHNVGGMPFFFTGSRPQNLKVSRDYHAIPYFNPQAEIFTFETIPRYGIYSLKSRYFSSTLDNYEENLLHWERVVQSDPVEKMLKLEETYLQLPEDLPASVEELAVRIAGEGTPLEQSLRLLEYFREDFNYTLNPVVPPTDMDFVEHFLQSKEGYCVYYASALAVMARTLDIPSRYVEGFITPEASSSSTYSITGKLAHSWVEIYLDGIGWIPFDPTPAGEDRVEPVTTPVITPIAEDPIISPQPTSAPLTPSVPVIPDQEGIPVGVWVFLSMLVLLPVTVLLFLRYRRYRLRAQYRIASVRKRFANREKQMLFYHLDLLRQLSCLDIHPEPGETLTEFAQRVDRRIKLPDGSMSASSDIVLRNRYGRIFPTRENVLLISKCHAQLEEYLQITLTPGQYLRKRVLGLQALLIHKDSID